VFEFALFAVHQRCLKRAFKPERVGRLKPKISSGGRINRWEMDSHKEQSSESGRADKE
jgi:hypothetical protein